MHQSGAGAAGGLSARTDNQPYAKEYGPIGWRLVSVRHPVLGGVSDTRPVVRESVHAGVKVGGFSDLHTTSNTVPGIRLLSDY